MTGRVCAALLVSSLGVVSLRAQADLYRYERPVETDGAGPRRLAIDFALLAGGAPFRTTAGVASGGLSDLRLVGAGGALVPHLLLYASQGNGDRPTARPPGAAPPPLVAQVEFERRPSEPGFSRYRLKLPGARLPIVALDLTVRTGHVLRDAVVQESRLAGGEAVPEELGRVRLTRVVRDGVADGPLRIPIRAPQEPEIDLTIDDGSNGPLDLQTITVTCAELPWIYFEAAGGPLLARYGDLTAPPPVYDLEVVRGTIDVDTLEDASWGAARARDPRERPLPAAALADMGAPLDPATFAYTRALPEGSAGLLALSLDAAVLAHSLGPARRFADVRILDESNRQVPYIVERRDEPLPVTLSLQRAESTLANAASAPGRSRSTYRVGLPYSNLPAARLVLDTPARVFQRLVQVGVERPADRRRRDPWFDIMETETWSHGLQETPAPALVLPIRGTLDATELLVTIEEGDNTPLPLSSARLLLPSYRLRFYGAGGTRLRLAYGRNDLALPQYDLSLLSSQVMGTEAREVMAAAEPAEPATRGASFISRRVFWGLLAGAVLVMLLVLGRLLRNEGAPGSA